MDMSRCPTCSRPTCSTSCANGSRLRSARRGASSRAIRSPRDRKSTRLNSSHVEISYAVFCLNHPATSELYTLSLHDALPISWWRRARLAGAVPPALKESFDRDGYVAVPDVLPADLFHELREWLATSLGEARSQQQGDTITTRSEEHTSELQSRRDLVCRLLLESSGDLRALHSFPTRRSSDLLVAKGTPRRGGAAGAEGKLRSRWICRGARRAPGRPVPRAARMARDFARRGAEPAAGRYDHHEIGRAHV